MWERAGHMYIDFDRLTQTICKESDMAPIAAVCLLCFVSGLCQQGNIRHEHP